MTRIHQTPVMVSVLALSLLLLGSTAHAVPITFNFTGTVSSVSADLSPTFVVNQPVTGSYTFESTAPDVDLGAIFGTYESTGNYSVNVNAGAYLASAPKNRITVGNDDAAFFIDTYRAFATSNIEGLTGPSVGGFSLLDAILFLGDQNGTVFSDDSLPTSPPNLGPFETKQLILDFEGERSVVINISSLTLAVDTDGVPEPNTAILAAIGLASLGFMVLRHRKLA